MRILFAPILALVLSVGPKLGDLPSPAGRGMVDIAAPAPADIPEWHVVEDIYGLSREIVFEVTVTGYSSSRDQCDADPFITASNTRVRPGIIALSRDMLRRYNPHAPLDWGDRVHVEGVGEFTVEDSMNARFEKRADIWFPDRPSATDWGVRELKLVLLPDGPPFL